MDHEAASRMCAKLRNSQVLCSADVWRGAISAATDGTSCCYSQHHDAPVLSPPPYHNPSPDLAPALDRLLSGPAHHESG